MVDKVYIAYKNERNAQIGDVFLSKKACLMAIANPSNDYLQIAPEERIINKTIPYTEEELKTKSCLMLKLVTEIDGQEIVEMGKIKLKHFLNKATDAVADLIQNIFINGGDT